jgi:hypothetical protein
MGTRPEIAPGLRGVVTERDLPAAELPGISEFYRRAPHHCTTFIELRWTFLEQR